MTLAPIEEVLTFCRLLRLAGVRVGLGETEDALKTLAAIDPRWSRRALKATLVKKKADEPIFDRVFELYFLHNTNNHEIYPPCGAALQETLTQTLTQGFGQEGGQNLGQGSTHTPSAYHQALERAVRFMLHHLAHARPDVRGVQEALILLSDMVQKQAQMPRQLERVRVDLERAFLNAQEPEHATTVIETLLGEADVEQVDFSQMDHSESVLVEAQVERLVKLIRTRPQRRTQPDVRGRLDMRRTLRRSLQYGGTTLKLARKKRSNARPKAFVLTDISGSVTHSVHFLLMLTQAFQHVIGPCRSFVFADETLEISNILKKEMERSTTLCQATKRLMARLNVSGWMARHSDYGTSLVQFYREIKQDIDRRTTIIIFGDARNNRAATQEHTLLELSRRVKYILWLNPERKPLWNSGDSIVARYASHCNHVLECRNLAQLRHVVDLLSSTLK